MLSCGRISFNVVLYERVRGCRRQDAAMSSVGIHLSGPTSREIAILSHRVTPSQRGSRAAKRGGFKRGGFPIWTCPSFFVLFCPFWDFPNFSGIFPICSGMVRGFSRFVLFLFVGLLTAPNSPERVRDTIWTFLEKSGKPPGLETPRFSFSQEVSGPSERRDTLPWSLVSHRHICGYLILQHTARYLQKTSTTEFCDAIATSITQYEEYHWWASKAFTLISHLLKIPILRVFPKFNQMLIC